jgi:hypothetical protein
MSSDYFSYDELTKLNEQIKEFKKSFVRIMRFCFNYELFMLDNGSLFFYLLSEFRRHAVMPTKWKSEASAQQPQEVLVLNGKLSSWAPVVIIGLTILSLTFLTIYKYLKPQVTMLGIIAVFIVAFSPQIIIRILAALGKETSGEDDGINYEEIFGEIIQRYKEALMHVRVNIRNALKKARKFEDDPLAVLQKLDLWEVQDPDAEASKEQAKVVTTTLPDPYGDVLETDEVSQSQVFFSAWVANQLGIIYNRTEKELYHRKKFILEKSAEAAGAQSSQSLKARVG